MPFLSFAEWLEEVPDAGAVALRIAQAGSAGVSLDHLCKVIGSSPETLEAMLRALVVSRQVVVVRVGGEIKYRATM